MTLNGVYESNRNNKFEGLVEYMLSTLINFHKLMKMNHYDSDHYVMNQFNMTLLLQDAKMNLNKADSTLTSVPSLIQH